MGSAPDKGTTKAQELAWVQPFVWSIQLYYRKYTQKMQYQDVEATDQLPCLAKYLTRHNTHEKEILMGKKYSRI
jgi:hypothetical protein